MLFSLLLIVPLVCAWGRIGHETVAYIAQNHVKTNLTSVLNFNGSLPFIANWPDRIRGRTHKYDKLHYVNVSPGSCEYTPSDCHKRRCVVAAIEDFGSHIDSVQSLSLLTHFCGDIAQPLHVTEKMHIGNNITVEFMGRKTSFHSLWDSGLINAFVTDQFQGNVSNFQNNLVKQSFSHDVSSVSPQQWANETAQVSCREDIWRDIHDGACIGKEYADRMRYIIENQLISAGVRLARIIDQYFDHKTIFIMQK